MSANVLARALSGSSAPSARECVWLLGDRAAGILDGGDGGVEVVGVEQDERSIGLDVLVETETADLAVTLGYPAANKTASDPAATIPGDPPNSESTMIGSSGPDTEHDHCRDHVGSCSVAGTGDSTGKSTPNRR